MDSTAVKSERLLQIYSRLVSGDTLPKKELAQQFHVTERSIQRDMESLRCFFAEQGLQQDVVYDKAVKGYRLESSACSLLNNSEILAVCKILLESRSMRKDEMLPILDKLIACCVPERSKRAVTCWPTRNTTMWNPIMGSTFCPACGRSARRYRTIR